MVSPYSINCEYSLEIKLSKDLPCVLEENIGFTEMKYVKQSQVLDGYFVACKDKKVEYLLQKNKEKDNMVVYVAFVCSGVGGFVVLIVLYFYNKGLKWRK